MRASDARRETDLGDGVDRRLDDLGAPSSLDKRALLMATAPLPEPMFKISTLVQKPATMRACELHAALDRLERRCDLGADGEMVRGRAGYLVANGRDPTRP